MTINEKKSNENNEKKSGNTTKKNHVKTDWWTKSFAGCVLGFTLSLALIGLFALVGPGGIDTSSKTQFNMWMMAPLWMTVLSFTFLFPSGLRAVAWLGAANTVAYLLLFIIRCVQI